MTETKRVVDRTKAMTHNPKNSSEVGRPNMNLQDASVTFYCEGQKLYGNLAEPSLEAPCILMSHGFEASKDGTKWSFLAPKLNERGFATFRFSYRGCGYGDEKSEGEFEDTTLTGRIKDYRAALDRLADTRIDHGRIGVIGSSFGGEVPIAADDPRVKAMVLLATPSRSEVPSEAQMADYKRQGYFELPSGRRLKPSYFEDVSRYELCQAIAGVGTPVLIIHGGDDELVPVEQAHELYEHAGEPKRLEIIEGGGHALRDTEHMDRILELAREWFSKHL